MASTKVLPKSFVSLSHKNVRWCFFNVVQIVPSQRLTVCSTEFMNAHPIALRSSFGILPATASANIVPPSNCCLALAGLLIVHAIFVDMVSTSPVLIVLDFNLLSFLSCSTVVPNFFAILLRLSPLTTLYFNFVDAVFFLTGLLFAFADGFLLSPAFAVSFPGDGIISTWPIRSLLGTTLGLAALRSFNSMLNFLAILESVSPCLTL